MSTGKAAAQAAHALFMWLLSLTDSDRRAWFDTGRRFSVTGRSGSRFTQVREAAQVIVRDAGYTEIPAGSVTATVTA